MELRQTDVRQGTLTLKNGGTVRMDQYIARAESAAAQAAESAAAAAAQLAQVGANTDAIEALRRDVDIIGDELQGKYTKPIEGIAREDLSEDVRASLVSDKSIKTINGQTILGSGNLVIRGTLPAGGNAGQILVKKGSTDNDAEWQYPRYPRRNLLDNAVFMKIGNLPVNQREQNQYSTAGAFVFDRWKLISGTVELSANGLILNGTIQQTIEETIGQQYTASVLTANGIDSASFNPRTRVFSITSDGSAAIKAAKLELGSYQTLAHLEGTDWVLNEIPDYNKELTKCQRYLFIVTSASASGPVGSGYCPSDGQTATFFIPLPVTMRANSIPTFDGTLYIYAPGANGQLVTSVTASAYLCGNGVIFGAFVDSGITLSRGGGYVLRVNSGSKLIFSSEL